MKNVQLFCTQGAHYFAELLADKLEMGVSHIKRGVFRSNEEHSKLVTNERNSLTGNKIILVGACHTAEDFHELIVTGYHLVEEGAHSMIIVCPWYRGARQDRAKKPGEAVMASINAGLLKSIPYIGQKNHFLFMDLHNSAAILGYFKGFCPADEVYSEPVLVESLKSLKIDRPRFTTADLGRPDWAKSYARKYYGVDSDDDELVRLACVDKNRDANGTQIMHVIGGELVNGRNVATIDDLLDTCGTLDQAGNAYLANQALALDAVVPHFACADEAAIQKLLASHYRRIVTSNSHPMSQHPLVQQNPDRIIVNDVTGEFAKKIARILQ